MLQAINALLI